MTGGRLSSALLSCRCRLAEMCGLALLVCGIGAPAAAAPVVRGAQIDVVLTSPTSCEVDADYTIQIDRPGPIPFTLQTFDGTRVELASVNGAGVASSDLQRSGKTTIFLAQFAAAGSENTRLRYRVSQAAEWAYRCPIWLPAVPTDRRPGTVNLRVGWPAGASSAGTTLPPLQRTQTGGTSSLAHIPSFVRAPYLAAGETRSLTGWDVSRVVDAAAVVVLSGASLVWLALRERRRRRALALVRES